MLLYIIFFGSKRKFCSKSLFWTCFIVRTTSKTSIIVQNSSQCLCCAIKYTSEIFKQYFSIPHSFMYSYLQNNPTDINYGKIRVLFDWSTSLFVGYLYFSSKFELEQTIVQFLATFSHRTFSLCHGSPSKSILTCWNLLNISVHYTKAFLHFPPWGLSFFIYLNALWIIHRHVYTG